MCLWNMCKNKGLEKQRKEELEFIQLYLKISSLFLIISFLFLLFFLSLLSLSLPSSLFSSPPFPFLSMLGLTVLGDF